ncbi:MAG: hypothetical protein KGJ84_17510, partial [Elusimicrobia bacterium]|nr:hypothetical protein [Elusimicrobiota bacterium]
MAGLSAVLLLAAALNASAQSPMPYNNPPDAAPPPSTAPAASTDTAVAASTQTAAVSASTGGVHVAVAEKPKLVRPIRAILHATAKDWEPLSLKAGGDPVMAQTKVVLRQEKVKRRYKGRASPAKAIARLLKGKDEAWLVISVFPKALAARRAHFEVRFRIVENYVEDV